MGEDRLGAYREHGHIVVPGLWSAAQVDVALSHLDSLPPAPRGVLAVDPDHDPVAAALAADRALVALASELLEGPVAAFGVTYLVRPPRSELRASWHQDGEPWARVGIIDALTVWLALDPATRESGGLRVVPGSHRAPPRPLVRDESPDEVFGWVSAPGLVEDSDARDVELDAGDASVHHPALFHSSGPNRTDRRRAALGVRYRLDEP